MSTQTRMTYRDYAALPEDGPRCELIDGELVKMSPAPSVRHQKVVFLLARWLAEHVEARKLGLVLHAPLDVVLGDAEVLQPDIVYVSSAREGIVEDRGIVGAPDLCCEVLSPGTRERDLTVKRGLYTRYGVQELWYVDLEARRVELYRPLEEPAKPVALFHDREAFRSPLLPDFSFPVARLFEG